VCGRLREANADSTQSSRNSLDSYLGDFREFRVYLGYPESITSLFLGRLRSCRSQLYSNC